MTRYGMVIDTRKCFGCQTCAMACKTSNNLPKGTFWNRVINSGDTRFDCGGGEFPNVDMKFKTVSCQHCKNPSCVEVCPTGASYQTEEGIVLIDPELCIGCKSCMNACPYDVRVLNDAEPEYYLDFAIGDGYEQEHVGNVVEKCNFCYQRITNGGIPACMELCPGRARFWGDLDDPNSDASKAIEGREVTYFLEEEGTEPTTMYLV